MCSAQSQQVFGVQPPGLEVGQLEFSWPGKMVSPRLAMYSKRASTQFMFVLADPANSRYPLFQVAGGSLRDAQTQLGHSKMSTTLEIYTLPIPEQQRATVEKLSVLMANDGRKDQNPDGLPLASQQIQ